VHFLWGFDRLVWLQIIGTGVDEGQANRQIALEIYIHFAQGEVKCLWFLLAVGFDANPHWSG
jgi:hypothetical protein